MSKNNIIEIEIESDKRWDNFVQHNIKGSIYHTSSWLKSISEAMGYKVYYFGVEDNNSGNLQGIFHCAKIRNLFSGHKYISFPLTTHSEILIEDEHLEEIFKLLKIDLKKNDVIEFRTFDYLTNIEGGSLINNYMIHILELEETAEKTFNKFHGTSVRASIRRADKKGLSFEIHNNILGLEKFYSLYLSLRARLGLPALPFNFFKVLFENLLKEKKVFIPLVKQNNHVIAAGFILKFKDTFYLEYTVSDHSKLNLYPNHKLFWGIINLAIEQGARFIDFGRTDVHNESLKVFKDKWNTKQLQLNYWQFGVNSGSNVSFENKNTLMKINKFMPKSIIKLQGKIFYKYKA